MNGYLCNMATTTASCFASFLLFVCVTPATLPDRMTSSIQAMSQELDLTDLSLPPEVITEALFNQVDLIQDQLEQCEEMVSATTFFLSFPPLVLRYLRYHL